MANHRGPVGVEAIGDFDTLVDARSPSEYALDHLPGAVNHPVLNDEERALVGTIYKQKSAFEARRIGGGLVAANLGRHWAEAFADKPESWRPLVYCWRGGLRSGSMVTWMRMTGWDAQQLKGGYKAFRRHVVESLPPLIHSLRLVVLCGQTGTAKTRILQAMAAQGHKGSMLGAWPGQPQPPQKQFETQLYTALKRLDPSRPVYTESESARIGSISLPLDMVAHLRASTDLVEIDASPESRLDFLLRDYAYLGDDPGAFADLLGRFKQLQGNETITRWQAWAQEGNLPKLFAELMSRHYDPQYSRSLGRNFSHWDKRHTVQADDLSDAGIARLAETVRGLFEEGTDWEAAWPSLNEGRAACRSRSVPCIPGPLP